jgi:hypothetical protein
MRRPEPRRGLPEARPCVRQQAVPAEQVRQPARFRLPGFDRPGVPRWRRWWRVTAVAAVRGPRRAIRAAGARVPHGLRQPLSPGETGLELQDQLPGRRVPASCTRRAAWRRWSRARVPPGPPAGCARGPHHLQRPPQGRRLAAGRPSAAARASTWTPAEELPRGGPGPRGGLRAGAAAARGHPVNMQLDAQHWDRFGFNLESGRAHQAARRVAESKQPVPAGLHCHIGTYVDNVDLYRRAARKPGGAGRLAARRHWG